MEEARSNCGSRMWMNQAINIIGAYGDKACVSNEFEFVSSASSASSESSAGESVDRCNQRKGGGIPIASKSVGF